MSLMDFIEPLLKNNNAEFPSLLLDTDTALSDWLFDFKCILSKAEIIQQGWKNDLVKIQLVIQSYSSKSLP